MGQQFFNAVDGMIRQSVQYIDQPFIRIHIVLAATAKQRIENGEEDNIPYFFAGYEERVKKGVKGDRAMIT